MEYSMKNLALAALAVAGAVVPWWFIIQFFVAEPSLMAFLAKVFANPASIAVAIDILLASIAFWIWLVPEARRVGMERPWIYIALTFIALATAVAVFFIVRDGKLEKTTA